MTAGPSPLYSRLQEFTMPVSAKKDAEEEHVEGKHDGGSLFERVNAEQALPKAKAAEVVTANVLEMRINPDLADGNLTDGYKLHDLKLSNLDNAPERMTDTAFESSVQSVSADILPVLELDFSSDAAARREAPEPTGARYATV